MTTWKGREPTSFTTTLYNADIPYDFNVRYDGLTIINTSWNGRPTPGDIISSYLIDVELDRLIDAGGGYLGGLTIMQKSSWKGRIIPN